MSMLTEKDQQAIRRMSAEGEVCSDMRRPVFRYTSEERLWSACLYEAVMTYLGMGVCTREKDRQEAREWFGATFAPGRSPVGSFEWVCIILEIDAVQVRRRLVRLDERTGGDGRAARKLLAEMRRGSSEPILVHESAA